MKAISTKNAIVYFNSEVYQALNTYIKLTNPSKIFVLSDSNTHKYCLPLFLEQINLNSIAIKIMEMPEGENHKTLDICINLWKTMSKCGADRNSLLINLYIKLLLYI